MATLEAAFQALCEKHDLRAISVTWNYGKTGECAAYVHWDGFSRDGNECASAMGGTASEALERAIAESYLDRTPASELPELQGVTVEVSA